MIVGWLSLVACGSASLDGTVPSATTGGEASSGTLPALDTAGESTTDGGTTGDEPALPDPAWCEPGCRITLPVRWSYEGVPDSGEVEPGSHYVPGLLREADGGVTVAEQRRRWATLHGLDATGALRWNRPLPLPCDECELDGVSRHPSGDLLLGAAGNVIDGDFAILTGRYDPEADVLRWASTHAIEPGTVSPSRSGDVVALSDSLVLQLFLQGDIEFVGSQSIGVLVYGADGELLEREWLETQTAQTVRWPLLLRPSSADELVVAIPRGSASSPYAQLGRMEAPLWSPSGTLSLPEPLDDLEVDDRGHTLTLSHTFDGDRMHLLLDDRAGLEPQPRWVATLAVASVEQSRADLAIGPDGDLYTAVRTAQRLELPDGGEGDGGDDGEDAPSPEPLVGLALARWTSQGELRWSTTVLMDVALGPRPVAIEVDDDEGLLLATVAGGRLRVERWQQQCECE